MNRLSKISIIFFVKDGQGALAQLTESLEKLQPLAEHLDPLETSYADVRFLDVDHEQTERQYESIMEDLRREIDEENELIDTVKQLEAELKNLQSGVKEESIEQLAYHSSHTLPEIRSRIEALTEKSVIANKKRRIVQPSAPLARCEALLSDVDASVKANLKSLAEEQQDASIKKIRAMLADLQQQPTADNIKHVEEKLNQLGFTNPIIEELKQNLALIKQNQAEKDKAKQEVEHQLELVSDKLKQIYEKYPATTKESKPKKRKKGQQKGAIEAEKGDRKMQIHELRRNVDELESVLLPSLAKLKEEAANTELETVVPEQQHARASELVLTLKVSITIKSHFLSIQFNLL